MGGQGPGRGGVDNGVSSRIVCLYFGVVARQRAARLQRGSCAPFELYFPAFLSWPSWLLRCMTVIVVPSHPEKMSEVRLPPVRTLDDFLLGSTRLAPPDLRDLQRWHNRVINNLLYYQSNYLLVLGVGLLLGG